MRVSFVRVLFGEERIIHSIINKKLNRLIGEGRGTVGALLGRSRLFGYLKFGLSTLYCTGIPHERTVQTEYFQSNLHVISRKCGLNKTQ